MSLEPNIETKWITRDELGEHIRWIAIQIARETGVPEDRMEAAALVLEAIDRLGIKVAP